MSRTLFQGGKEHWSAYFGKNEASVLHKHETKHHQQLPADWKIKVYNYHIKPLRRQIDQQYKGLNFLIQSEMSRGGKIPHLVIMVGDKEVHNSVSERKQVAVR